MKYSDDKTVDDRLRLPDFQMSPEAASARGEIMKNITTYADEMTLKFITGVVPISEFDKYIKQLKELQMDKAIEITQQSYDKFMKKELPKK
jgi:putative aldouronate transport system substrate-binding protein